MNEADTQRRKIMIIFGLMGIVIAVIIIAIFQAKQSSTSDVYQKDSLTGDSFYRDKNQAPETATYKQFVSLLNSSELYKNLGVAYFEQVRSDIETTVNKLYPGTKEVYVKGDVGKDNSRVTFSIVPKDERWRLRCSSTLLKTGVATTICD